MKTETSVEKQNLIHLLKDVKTIWAIRNGNKIELRIIYTAIDGRQYSIRPTRLIAQICGLCYNEKSGSISMCGSGYSKTNYIEALIGSVIGREIEVTEL